MPVWGWVFIGWFLLLAGFILLLWFRPEPHVDMYGDDGWTTEELDDLGGR